MAISEEILIGSHSPPLVIFLGPSRAQAPMLLHASSIYICRYDRIVIASARCQVVRPIGRGTSTIPRYMSRISQGTAIATPYKCVVRCMWSGNLPTTRPTPFYEHTYTHPYEHTYANPNLMSTSKGLSHQILRFTKSLLSTGTSPTTVKHSSVKSWNKSTTVKHSVVKS